MAWLQQSRSRLRATLSNAAESLHLQDRISHAAETLHVQEAISRATESVHQKFEHVQQALSPQDLEGQFEAEARKFPTINVEAAVATLQQWDARLTGGGAEAAIAPDVVRAALLRSGALISAVSMLMQTPSHCKVLSTKCVTNEEEPELKQMLLRVVGCVSTLPADVLKQLVTLLAQIHEDINKYTSRSKKREAEEPLLESATKNSLWALSLLGGALVLGNEKGMLENAAHIRAAGRTLAGEAEEDLADNGAMQQGSEVWAAQESRAGEQPQPPSGMMQWRRARVSAMSDGRVQVEWAADSPDVFFARQASARASSDDGSPASEGSLAVPSLALPCGLSSSFFVNAADRISDDTPVSAAEGLDETFAHFEEWASRCQDLRAIFSECAAKVCAFSRRHLSEDEWRIGAKLRKIRTEREKHAEALAQEAEQCSEVVQSHQAEVKASSEAFGFEIKELQVLREKRAEETNQILDKKRKLLAELAEVDAELEAAEEAARELSTNERRLEDNMRHVSESLSGRLSSQGKRHDKLIKEHQMILGVCQVAAVVEADAAARSTAAEAAAADCASGLTVAPALAAACVHSEARRYAALLGLEARVAKEPIEMRQKVMDLAEQAAVAAEALARATWSGLGLNDRSTMEERRSFDDALAMRDKCREVAIRLQPASPSRTSFTVPKADTSASSTIGTGTTNSRAPSEQSSDTGANAAHFRMDNDDAADDDDME